MSEEKKCGCGEEHHNHEVSTDELARHNHFMINTMIRALISKGVLSNDDINKAVDDLQKMASEKQ
ncbi:MAG: hypothetical protein ACQESF_01810 [Nanobdellota archaeon]